MRGHTTESALQERAEHGPNALPEAKRESIAGRLLRQFRSPLIYILLAALGIDLFVWFREGAHGLPLESISILAILLLNAGLGLWQEMKAEDALARLQDLSAPQAWVLRDGNWSHIASREIVPGDQVRLSSGDRIPADGKVYGATVAADESILTGESLPVDKNPGDEAFSGTLVVRGQAFLDVTRIGPASALGKLAGMLGGIRQEPTPLERKLTAFGNRIAKWILIIAVIMLLEGVITRGIGALPEALLFSVSLAVAAVPEGLPAVLSLALALGVERMATRRAIVRRLASVESLGSVTVIVTDKTGTLTENRMTVESIHAPDEARFLHALSYAHDAVGDAGDPEDLAAMRFTAERGVNPQGERLSSRPFESAAQFMRVTVRDNGSARSYLKGSTEAILARSTLSAEEQTHWRDEAQALSKQGYRVLAVADAEGETDDNINVLGLLSLWDPPRAEVPNAIRTAQSAGVRVIMATGDHPATAAAVAERIGFASPRVMAGPDFDKLSGQALDDALRTTDVFARVKPEHKLTIVERLQAQGEIVAMTGDGVNDAPALKRSDIGLAMGQRGSDVTREVADLVLADDNFATIVSAIDEGRGIYANVRKFVIFLFSTNFGEILFIAGGTLLAVAFGLRDPSGNFLLPLTAVQILWINLITDGLPALAMALDRDQASMKHGPRPPNEGLLDRRAMIFIGVGGGMAAFIAFGILGLAQTASWTGLNWTTETARTAAFQFLAIKQLFFVYPSRRLGASPAPNRAVHFAVINGCAIQLFAEEFTPLQRALDLTPLDWRGYAVVAGCVAVSWFIATTVVRVLNRSAESVHPPAAA